MKKSILIALAVVMGGFAACGGSVDNRPDVDAGGGDADVIVQDIGGDAGDVAVDSGSDVRPEDAVDVAGDGTAADADADVAVDVPGDADVSPVDVVAETVDAVEETVEPGEFGWPCDSNDDCDFGPCLPTDDGRICSMDCTTSACPDGFSCEPYSFGENAILLCVPRFINLCRPCETALDCSLDLAATAGMACRELEFGAGTYCAAPCSGECPDGYECRESGDGDGMSWCFPVSGVCGCSVLAIEAGATTTCTVGVAGIETRCGGTRTCLPAGLSECSARAPDGEKCNGIDDDCDGLTDEVGAVDCTKYYFDLDNDGEGLTSVARCLCAPQGTYRATRGGDCDDANPDINTSAAEQCNTVDDDCDGQTDEAGAVRCKVYHADADGDNVGSDIDIQCLCAADDHWFLPRGGDCDDASALIQPGAIDDCNGVDDDCDGVTDPEDAEGCSVWYQDIDDDTYGNAAEFKCLCLPAGNYTAAKVGDCNDIVGTINPGAEEVCNGLDDNCDLAMDPEGSDGCTPWFADRDGDGYGVMWDSRCLCRKTDVYTATQVGDCNDDSVDIRPNAFEACGNSIDENCNGFVGEAGALGCETYWADSDQDGFGDVTASACLCGPEYPFTAVAPGDCDDLSGSVSPLSNEVCGNSVDDDCDGSTDEAGCAGCTVFFLDVDRDGYGVTGVTNCLSAPDESSGYVARSGGDCLDGNNQVHPGAIERCNGLDDNCDGLTDPDNSVSCIWFYFDFDGDGYGLTGNSRCLCGPTGNYTAVDDGDCDDTNPKVGGGAESCNGVDDNCNGRVDEENAVGCQTYYLDDDGDGVGVAISSKCLCSAAGRYSTRVSGDCDDSNVSVRPGASDTCNGIDDNCDGTTDPEGAAGCSVWFKDGDGDGFGVTGLGKCLCAAGGGYITKKDGDCNDMVRSVSPAGIESCNSVDDNCDGQTDTPDSLGCTRYYADRDADGWGNYNDNECLCAATYPWTVTKPGDCDDGSAAVGPGGVETCNGKDDDCDGLTDEYGATGCTWYYMDTDRDGHGAIDSQMCSCTAEGLRDATVGGDCDDNNAAKNPSVTEVCNGTDDNCDGLKDPAGASGCTVYMVDRDYDGFGVAGDTQCLCAPTYPYTSLIPGDCDDIRALTRPGGTEECNGYDDNCDGVTDPAGTLGCLTYYRDADDDGYAIPGDWKCLCQPTAPYLELDAKGDCDDNNAAVNRGQTEVCDGFDNDCNGTTDDDNATGCLTRYKDADADGWGVAGDSVCRCKVAAPYTATRAGDCDDTRAEVSPGKIEVCNGLDDNCDGQTDPEATSGCEMYYVDEDQDGWGVLGSSKCLCSGKGQYTSKKTGDCNDMASAINPDANEVCGNNVDENCSGAMDEDGAIGCSWYFKDADTDGYGDASSSRCMCGPSVEYRVQKGGDCCDKDDRVYPYNTTWYTTVNGCGNWDFNCDNTVTKRWNDGYGGCGGWGFLDGCDLAIGWNGAVPACGVTMNWVKGGCGYCGFLWLTCCDEVEESRTQGCR